MQVDGTTDKFNAAFLAYFPSRVTVHPGDTVDFHENWSGEPHTVTMGTLVEDGLKAAQAAGPNSPPPPAFAQLPTLLPQGPGDANQNAAQPCFLASGAPPADPNTPCTKDQQNQPEFNGTQTYFNSGWLPEGDTFSVKLASSTKPGTYHYYCNLHGPLMSGTIVVVGSDKSIPSADTANKAGAAEQAAIVGKLLGPYNDAKAGKFPLPGVTNVAGYGAQGVNNGSINEFILPTIQTKVGQKVNWTTIGFHTITFGKAPIQPGGFITKAPDGSVHLNPAFAAPTGFPPAPPPPGGPPSGGPPAVKTIDGGSYDGSTYKSTGLIQSDPGSGQLVAYDVTFTKPGTYSYVCLLHPRMGGTVQVT
ncbi:MAG: hypothetical protein JO050_03155 [Acidimicrobiia bacterium]|nr:hypothetical protein [Acidimicrobiia bacterium]